MAKQLNYSALPSLAIAAGATTPDPLIVGVMVWSTTLGAPVSWNGASWNAAGSAPAGVTGPAASVVNAVPRFDNLTGNLVKTSPILITDLGEISVPIIATPSAPLANKALIFCRSIAGRMMLAAIGAPETNSGSTVQPFLARNAVGHWRPQGNSTALPGVFGYTAPTLVGTATARNVATTNFFTRLRRLGLVSVATAAGFVEARVGVAQVTIGNGAGLGGFNKIVRFGISDAAAVAGARMFIGVSSNVAAQTNVEPSTLLNSIGIGHGAADTTLRIYFGGSAAQPPIDLGVNFPANTLSVDAYELALFASPFTGNVGYTVTRLNTGATASGTLTAATAGTQLPLNTTLLSYQRAWRTNNATALAVGLDIISDYVENDN